MREFLLQRGRTISLIIVVLNVLAWGATPPLIAQDAAFEAHHAYSVSSIQGDYAVVNHYGEGGNLALGIGTEQFDGTGNCQGTLLLNRPTSTGGRQLVALTSAGTYTVSADGTGIIFLTVTLPDGTTRTATEDFVITRTKRIRGILVATAIVDEQRETSLVLGNGVFVTQAYTRRGDEPED
jgi:hypothetical protein